MRGTLVRTLAPCALVCASVFLGACEDGPRQIFNRNFGDLDTQNGYNPGEAFRQEGETGFENHQGSGDSAERARFCDQSETDELIRWMVSQPIIPDVSVGGVPFWSSTGAPMSVDDLVGRPEDGKLCDPSGVYSNAFTWGPNFEVVVFLNEDTRLIEDIQINGQYLGTLEGNVTLPVDGVPTPVHVKLDPRLRAFIGDLELTDYSSSADAASKPKSWLNRANITKIYGMVRQTYFGSDPLPAGFDCVASKFCDVIYSAEDESVPQQTLVVFQDSGVTLVFAPNGVITYIITSPVRVAPFETEATMSFASAVSGLFEPRLTSAFRAQCDLSLGALVPWSSFKQACIEGGTDGDRLLGRFNYTVHTQRDAVDVEFNGVTLGFLREAYRSGGALHDGERPADVDKLYSVQFSRSLNAPLSEFNPAAIASIYKSKLEARVRGLVRGGDSAHPLSSYTLDIPATLHDGPMRIGELFYLDAQGLQRNWINDLVDDLRGRYDALSASQRDALHPGATDAITVVEPFADAVLAVVSHGASESPAAVKRFRTTDEGRWSIAYAHFVDHGVPYRINVQYSMFFWAVTSVGVSAGNSVVDDLISAQTHQLQPAAPYFTANLLNVGPQNTIGLGGGGITVLGSDRELEMLQVEVAVPGMTQTLLVPGRSIADRGGFLRQIKGERYEFVPANVVSLYGKETSLGLYVRADGNIGHVDFYSFKGRVELCPGLSLGYGDNVRQAVTEWAETHPLNDYESCELVFNYAANGNVLDSVASLSRRISVATVGDRAITVSMWQ